MFEERKNLLTTIAKETKGASSRSAAERAADSNEHISRIKAILKSTDKGSTGDMPM